MLIIAWAVDKEPFIDKTRAKLNMGEENRKQQIKDRNERIREHSANNAAAISQTAMQRTSGKGGGEMYSAALSQPHFSPVALFHSRIAHCLHEIKKGHLLC